MFSKLKKFFTKGKDLNENKVQQPAAPVRVKKPYLGVAVAKVMNFPEYGFMYEDSKNIPGDCPLCHNTLEKIPNVNFIIRKRKGSAFSTYDGFDVVNQRFKDFCDAQGYNITFIPLVKSSGWYFFMPNDIFPVDEKRFNPGHANSTRHLRFKRPKGIMKGDDPCPQCGETDWNGIWTVYSKTRLLDSDDFIMRLPGFYGDFNVKFPVKVVGKKTAQLLVDNGLATKWFFNSVFSDVYYWDR